MEENKKVQGEKVKLLPSDFYMDGNRKVMTEQYHIKRGYCCGSGCRHCPYEPKAERGNTTLSKKSQ